MYLLYYMIVFLPNVLKENPTEFPSIVNFNKNLNKNVFDYFFANQGLHPYLHF